MDACRFQDRRRLTRTGRATILRPSPPCPHPFVSVPAQTIYLLRHAESAPSRELPEPDWPLSRRGQAQAENLATQLSGLDIACVCSSPFARAVATVRPFCEARQLPIEIEPDLRERRLSEPRTEHFQEPLRHSWEDFDYALPGGESSRTCQRRIVDCVTRLASSHPGTLLLGSHGNALALFLNALDPTFGWEGWKAMRNPDLFKVDLDRTLSWDRAFRFP